MKVFGELTELQDVQFRQNSQLITLEPNQATTYTASRIFQFSPGDSSQILVSEAATQTLTNKSMSGSSNTFTAIPAGTALSGQVPTANGGTGVNSTATFPTSGVVVTEAATESLTNKTLSGSTNTVTVTDTKFTIQDDGDATKQAVFQASGITTATIRTFTFPDGSTTLVGTDLSQTLTNKTLTSPIMTAPAVSDFTDYTQIATPANPASSHNRLYFKSDNNLYTLTSAGTEASLSATPTATPTVQGKTTSYFPVAASSVNIVTNADYTVLTTDGYQTILFSTGATGRTLNLPAVASNTGRTITIKKTDGGVGNITLDPNASETIDDNLTNILNAQYGFITLYCDGTKWRVVAVWDMVSKVVSAATITSTPSNVATLSISPGLWSTSALMSFNNVVANSVDLTITSTSATNGTVGDNRATSGTNAAGLYAGTVPNYFISVGSVQNWFLVGASSITQTAAVGARLIANRVG